VKTKGKCQGFWTNGVMTCSGPNSYIFFCRVGLGEVKKKKGKVPRFSFESCAFIKELTLWYSVCFLRKLHELKYTSLILCLLAIKILPIPLKRRIIYYNITLITKHLRNDHFTLKIGKGKSRFQGLFPQKQGEKYWRYTKVGDMVMVLRWILH